MKYYLMYLINNAIEYLERIKISIDRKSLIKDSGIKLSNILKQKGKLDLMYLTAGEMIKKIIAEDNTGILEKYK